ncbi:S-layer protein domain-containing protein, partial [Methanolobus psychrotolerans]|uniref:S-layer protein domain-containing protein n=1 Tax=Methanolobus psychrotolerans TaxID=1874706 RepID=UPI002413F1E9
MKRFTTIALIALVAIAALIVPATAAVQSVEVRSSVYDPAIDGVNIVINATTFAGFWYDMDEDLSSEEMNITFTTAADRSIADGNLEYITTVQQTGYDQGDFDLEPDFATNLDNDTYPVIGLFADKYVPLDDNEADELVKLLLDTDDKYTLRTGSALELANGYALTAKQIDVEGNKVWMELSKDGDFIEDEVITPTAAGFTWTYDTDVGDKEDVIV